MVASVDLIGNSKIIIGSAYISHDSASNPLEEIRLLVIRGLPLLLEGDINSHYTLWGSTDTNRRGKDLVDYLITTGGWCFGSREGFLVLTGMPRPVLGESCTTSIKDFAIFPPHKKKKKITTGLDILKTGIIPTFWNAVNSMAMG